MGCHLNLLLVLVYAFFLDAAAEMAGQGGVEPKERDAGTLSHQCQQQSMQSRAELGMQYRR